MNGRVMVPMRTIFEAFGAAVEWERVRQTITVTAAEGDVIALTIGETTVYINDIRVGTDVAPMMADGQTWVSVGFAALTMGYEASWDGNLRRVTLEPRVIYSGNAPIPNRRLTDEELMAWIADYNRLGVHEFELEVVRLTNIARAEAGVASFEVCDILSKAARFKAQGMYYLNYFSHENPIYGSFHVIPRQLFGYSGLRLAENLSRGRRSPGATMTGWMNSQGHSAIMIRPDFTTIGVGFYNNHWVQLFGDSID